MVFDFPDGLVLVGFFPLAPPFPSLFEFPLVSLEGERDLLLFPFSF